MLINSPTVSLSQTEIVLKALRESKHHYYMTGSRFFGTASNASDHDFFVQDSPEVREELKTLGFRQGAASRDEPEHTYKDLLCVAVWTLTDERGLNFIQGSRRIDVQLVTDASLKNMVQEQIKSHNFVHMLGKNNKQRSNIENFWSLLISVAMTQKTGQYTDPSQMTVRVCAECKARGTGVNCLHWQSGQYYCPQCATEINKHNQGIVLWPINASRQCELLTLGEFHKKVKYERSDIIAKARWATETHYDIDSVATGPQPLWATHLWWET